MLSGQRACGSVDGRSEREGYGDRGSLERRQIVSLNRYGFELPQSRECAEQTQEVTRARSGEGGLPAGRGTSVVESTN